jgi:hypothetical protein
MNRVFVFGAGASKHAGGPLMGEFMYEGMFYLCNKDAYDRRITADSFDKVFELVDLLYHTSFTAELDQATRQGLWHIESRERLRRDVSVEHVLDCIDVGMSSEADLAQPVLDYHQYKKALDDFIFETIQLGTTHGDSYSIKSDGTTNHSRNLYDMLVDHGLDTSDRNSFVTFNYDLLLDKAVAINDRDLLGDYAVPFASVLNFDQYERIRRGERLPRDVDILKLHGSLNWAVCTRCKAPHLAYYWQYNHLPQDYCRHCQCPLSAVLVSPTPRKRIEQHPFLADVWRRAQEVLCRANEIVVVGYSFPEADAEARHLFRNSLARCAGRPRVFLVEPICEVLKKIRTFFLDLGAVEICGEYHDFTQYCKEIGCYRE